MVNFSWRSFSVYRTIRSHHVLPEENSPSPSIEWNDTLGEWNQLDGKLDTKDLKVDVFLKNLDRNDDVVVPALTDDMFSTDCYQIYMDDDETKSAQDQVYTNWKQRI